MGGFLLFIFIVVLSAKSSFIFGEGQSGERRSVRRADRQGIGLIQIWGWVIGLFGLLKGTDPKVLLDREAAEARQEDIINAIKKNNVPPSANRRLTGNRIGALPWIATLTPAELLITRSHGIRPIASVSATCWMQYGYSWTEGHQQGWETALERLRNEARVAGANAVVDVKMRTIPMDVGSSMDFTLVGTAIKIDGLPPSKDPIIATVPALEFVKLLDANIIPTGIAVGAHYEWGYDWRGNTNNLFWVGNTEVQSLSQLWERVRQRAHSELRESAKRQGSGALAHINFSQMFERELDKQPKQYLARHIVIATVVDMPEISPLAIKESKKHSIYQGEYMMKPSYSSAGHITRSGIRVPRIAEPFITPYSSEEHHSISQLPIDFQMVVDMSKGTTTLKRKTEHHQSYTTYEEEGAI